MLYFITLYVLCNWTPAIRITYSHAKMLLLSVHMYDICISPDDDDDFSHRLQN